MKAAARIFALLTITFALVVAAGTAIAGDLPDYITVVGEKDWVLNSSQDVGFGEPDGSFVVCCSINEYISDSGPFLLFKKELILSGDIVVRTYGVFDSQTKDFIAGFAQILKDGAWYTEEEGGIQTGEVRGPDGKLVLFTITLLDKDDKSVIQSEIKRK